MTSPVAYWHVPDIEAKLAEVNEMPDSELMRGGRWLV